MISDYNKGYVDAINEFEEHLLFHTESGLAFTESDFFVNTIIQKTKQEISQLIKDMAEELRASKY